MIRIAAVLSLSLLTGCALGPLAPPASEPGLSIHGNVHGGQQPIVGSHVYLFAANTTGYGQPSVSTLSPTAPGVATDSVGSYVTTDVTGSFTITGDYTCTAGTQLYIYALGGNPGSGTNNAAGLLAILGACPASGSFRTTVPFISVNEVSTVAAAYAMAGFAIDATHVSSSGTPLAQTGIANAFANAANLASISTGTALATTPAGNGTAPQSEINTLANILATCINSTGTITGPTNPTACFTLFNSAQSSGTTGAIPTDTATAAINIAHNPAASISTLFSLQLAAGAPFQPSLTTAPNDFTIALNFTGPSINYPSGIAVDGSGNVWTINTIDVTHGPLTVTKLASSGAVLSGPNGYVVAVTAANIPGSLAIDQNGDAWLSGYYNIFKISSSGTVSTYTPDSGFDYASLAIDASGNVWCNLHRGAPSSMTLIELSPAGTDLHFNTSSPVGTLGLATDSAGNVWTTSDTTTATVGAVFATSIATSADINVTETNLDAPYGVAIDSTGNPWVINQGDNSLVRFAYNASTQSYSPVRFIGGGLNYPFAIAIDGSSSTWIANGTGSSLSHFLNDGTPVTPATGYTNTYLNFPAGIAGDPSGNIWVGNGNGNSITEFIGASTPVVAPLSVGVKNGTLGRRP